ncbi:protein-methionine-sulfoxide reductase heme-binding subunit MsrQ [Alisedimentitalea sp. MJ-SS2]|uniref:protein-methionine-sulfoxide reductase heme-binding subunit MsrQ n=1 Tax=Aliisedimentitalea sp. MJ-SS2 TaxID=3049795 RepID=UPI00291079AB|nr:protein-methionine-sulfoxide reductase heme-binding subunit MsrQ [Alisedimentitalea sp. MJ-SS2]MDU8929415.1 protein-methionine-sulfoxide reductase heme-binding subunit MsrQ [Alisedimentitalea sp. MJ-SS2]
MTRHIPTWLIYAAGFAHIAWLFWLGETGGLGPEPINALERELGEMGLKLIIAGLTITPLMRLARVNLVKFRRAIGLTAFLYICVHLLVWLLLDVFLLSEIWGDIVKRPYITVGMAGFVALVPLAVTSNNWSVRKMGAGAWKRLHRLTYIAAVLGAVHFVMIGKVWEIEALAYLGVVVALLALRVKPRFRQRARMVG